jgi:hypothetical protein
MTESASTALIIATISCAFGVVNYLLFFLAIHVHFKLAKRVQEIEDRQRREVTP